MTADEPPEYDERLHAPWWSWPAAVAAAAVLATELMVGLPELPVWLPYAVLLPAAAVLPWRLGRLRVTVTADELRVDDARLPLAVVSEVVALDAAGVREVLGVGAHPLAFVVQRPWVRGAVQVLLDDPADPTPFWVVGTRRPAQLATALLRRRDAAARG